MDKSVDNELNEDFFLPTAAATASAGAGLGRAVWEFIGSGRLKLPFLITLSGDLGAGKTTFCQGLGQGLGVEQPGEIVSPTFTLANEYQGFCEIYHLDIYRLSDSEQFYEAGLDEYLSRPGLCLVEWPEKLPAEVWPAHRLDLSLTFHQNGRAISAPPHPLWAEFGRNIGGEAKRL